MGEKRFVVREAPNGGYVAGRGGDHTGVVEASLFLVRYPQHAAKLTREAALGPAEALPALGMTGAFAVEEVKE